MKHPEPSPAELLGSTPDDLFRSDSQEICNPARTWRSHSHTVCAERENPLATTDTNASRTSSIVRDETSQAVLEKAAGPEVHREYAVSDHLDRKTHFSTTTPSTLNAVVDRIIERTQSIASTTASIRMPVLAKRYRPRPVHVRTPHLRHHSLPSELPAFQKQSSLEDDLKEWMIHTAASDQSVEIDLDRSPTVSSTTASIASRQEMMKMLASFPDVREQAGISDPAELMTQNSAIALENVATATNDLPETSQLRESPIISETVESTQISQLGNASIDVEMKRSMKAEDREDEDVLLQNGFFSAARSLLPSQSLNIIPSKCPQQDGSTPLEDDASTADCPLPLSQPGSPSLASDDPISEEEIALAARFPLPPSQPNSPPLAFIAPCQAERTVSSQQTSAITRKPVPPSANARSARSSPLVSSNPYHLEHSMHPRTTRAVQQQASITTIPSRPPYPTDAHDVTLPNSRGDAMRPRLPYCPYPIDDDLEVLPNTTLLPPQRPTLPPPIEAEPQNSPSAVAVFPPQAVLSDQAALSAALQEPPTTSPPASSRSPPLRPPKELIEHNAPQSPPTSSISPPTNSPPQPQSPPPPVPQKIKAVTEEQPKPMTAEAKRRAAHARRMKIAFG